MQKYHFILFSLHITGLSCELVPGGEVKVEDSLSGQELQYDDAEAVDVARASEFGTDYVFGVHVAYGSSNICENPALLHPQHFG